MRGRNVTKPFSIAGFIFGEIYMLAAVLAPYHTGEAVPFMGKVYRILGGFPICGAFGAVIGMGIGLLVGPLLKKRP